MGFPWMTDKTPSVSPTDLVHVAHTTAVDPNLDWPDEPPYLSFPVMWSEQFGDGCGGLKPDRPDVLYISIPAMTADVEIDDPPVFSINLADALIEMIGGCRNGAGVVDANQRAPFAALAQSFRDIADHIDAALNTTP